MAACHICLRQVRDDAEYHPACLSHLFGAGALPRLDLDLGGLNDLAQQMVGRMSISGVQRKVLVSLSPDRKKLEFTPSGGRYILKPPIDAFPEIPANEHVTMQMAALVGIEIPPCGLASLKDGALAYLIARFDRLEDGGKLQQEDFCQVAGLPPSRKYDQSAELCIRLLRQYASEPLVSILALYRLLLFAWTTGNGDLHLKNLSLLTGTDGVRRLSPAYDLVNTKLVIRGDRLALSVGGKTDDLKRADWVRFGQYCRLPERVINQTLARQTAAASDMLERVADCFLSDEMKEGYAKIVRENMARLAQ